MRIKVHYNIADISVHYQHKVVKMFVLTWLLTFLILRHHVAAGDLQDSEDLSVYGPVPGLDPSPYYRLRVRRLGDLPWLDTFTLVTECTATKFCNTTSMFPQLKDWSNSYVNFQMKEGLQVEVEVTKLWDEEVITKAVVRPEKAADTCEVRDGKVYVVISKPGLFTVDINGQMEDQDTGKLPSGGHYSDNGPPIHTVTVFANPFLENVPKEGEDGVRSVKPGEEAPSEGDWHTLMFLPGVHHIGVSFPVHAHRRYYIPGDCVVYGTMNNLKNWQDGKNISIYGHGTLSGDLLPHPNHADPRPDDDDFYTYSPVHIDGAADTSVEGITIANSAFHSLMLVMGYKEDTFTDMRWVKIFTWRANGDGINPFGNGLIEDCFIRTQDDSTYVNGKGIRRVVYWNDANGSTFVLSPLGGGDMSHEVVVEDCTVVYARAKWHHWSGGRLFNMRGEGKGTGGDNVVFRNIRVEDPRPTLQHFMVAMQGVKPWSDPAHSRRGPGDLIGVRFENVSIAASSVLGEEDVLWGMEDGRIMYLVFRDVVIAGKSVTGIDHFYHNEFVYDFDFE